MTDVLDVRGIPLARPAIADRAAADESRGAAEDRPAKLRSLLIRLDFAAAWLSWIAVFTVGGSGALAPRLARAGWEAGLAAAATCVLLAVQKLYRSRVCAVRTVELSGLIRASLVCGGVVAALNGLVGLSLSPWVAALGGGLSLLALAGTRRGYADWVSGSRARGRFVRPVCVLGVNDEAEELVHLLLDQPELGYRVVAVLGDEDEWAARGVDVPVVAPKPDAAEAAKLLGASGVIVALSAVAADGPDRIVRNLVSNGLHVQVSSGFTRVGRKRMCPSPVGHQLLFYVEPTRFAPWQATTKRVMDVALAAFGLVVAAPAMAVAGLAIKLGDRGPVLYRQTRVGRDGRPFTLMKFRTMVPNAAEWLETMSAMNERNGPLFKVTDDPRETRIGRLLRATSFDEVPQLVNVLKGDMSLVGPRPALPSEVAQFDVDLLDRCSVLPGVTGLWQVEARDNASFRAYRRLDLFYVDNWSIALDLTILVSTVRVVIGRGFRTLRSLSGGANESGASVRPARTRPTTSW